MSRRDFGGCGGNAASNDEPADVSSTHCALSEKKSFRLSVKGLSPLTLCFGRAPSAKSPPQIAGRPSDGACVRRCAHRTTDDVRSLSSDAHPPIQWWEPASPNMIHPPRPANHHMVHRLVPNDVDDFIQRAERIPIHLNIAYGMCEGELGIGQRKSDPSITQIDTKPNHAWRISPSEPGRPMPQVPRRSWWRPRRHPVRSPACRRHHRQEPWKRHGPDHQP